MTNSTKREAFWTPKALRRGENRYEAIRVNPVGRAIFLIRLALDVATHGGRYSFVNQAEASHKVRNKSVTLDHCGLKRERNIRWSAFKQNLE